MARPSRRAELLDAAIAVIRRDGARALTLDAVAAEAGVSKGGVLYHFASKRALIDGLLERWLDDFEAGLGAGPVALAYVRCCDLGGADQRRAASEFGLLAALIEEPQVLEAVRGSATRAGWSGCSPRPPTRPTRGSCGSRRTVCGIPICSASPPPPGRIAAA